MTYKQALALYKLASLKCAINYAIKQAAKKKDPEIIELTPEQLEQIQSLRQQAAVQMEEMKPKPKPKTESSGGWLYPAAMITALGLLSYPAWSSVIRGGAKGVRSGMQSGSNSIGDHFKASFEAQQRANQEKAKREWEALKAKRQAAKNTPPPKPMTKEELSLHWMKNSH